MKIQPKMERTIALAGLLALLPAAAFAKPEGSVAVDRIDVTRSDRGREVVIHTSKEPTFSVFRLSDPFRVLVDVNDARVGGVPELSKINDGVVRYVATSKFADEASAIVRVEIALEASLQYRVRAEASSIVVSIEDKAGVKPEDKATPVAAPSAEPTPVVEAAPLVQLGTLTAKREKSRTVLSAKIQSGKIDANAVRVEELTDPPRLVVHVGGAETDPRWQKVNVDRFGVKRARVGAEAGDVRIVLDLEPKSAAPKVDVETVGGTLALALSKAEVQTAQPVAAKAEPAPKAEPVVEIVAAQPKAEPKVELAAQPAKVEPQAAKVEPQAAKVEPQAAKGPVSRVVDAKFEPKDGFMRFTIVLASDEDVTVEKVASGRAGAEMLRLANVALPENLERTLDTTEVAGEVLQSLSTYREGKNTIIAAAVGENTENRHWKKGNRLMWDFRAAQVTPVRGDEQARVLSYPEQATSGYVSTAVSIPSGLSTGAAKYKGRRISLDLKDAEIQNVLRLLADVSKLNIVASDDVRGKITIKLRNVPWDQALDIILRAKGLDKTRSGNILRVAPIEVLRKEEELRVERRAAQEKLEPLSVRLIPVSYAVAAEVKPQVSALLSPRGKVNIDTRTNVLVVEDIAEILLKVERLVRTLDTQTPQVLIEARIVEANTAFSRQLGIQWGGNVSMTQQFGTSTGLSFPNQIRISGASDDATNAVEGVLADPNYAVNLPAPSGAGNGGALGFVFGSAGGSALVSLRLSAAERTGKVKIISAPRIVTLDNKEARILSGEKVPITVVTANGPTTRFIDANLSLGVTPHVTQDGSVLLNIAATKNELSGRTDVLGTPGILTKEAQTEMLVRDGDTAVLGGIYRRTATENKSYVPWVGQIPVLGWIFKTTTKLDSREELLIFVTPRIVNRSQALVSAQ